MAEEKTDCVATLVSGVSYSTGRRKFANGKPVPVSSEEAIYLESTGAFTIHRPENGAFTPPPKPAVKPKIKKPGRSGDELMRVRRP